LSTSPFHTDFLVEECLQLGSKFGHIRVVVFNKFSLPSIRSCTVSHLEISTILCLPQLRPDTQFQIATYKQKSKLEM